MKLQIQDWGFYLIVATLVAIMSTLVLTDSLPEKAAAQFNTLTDININSNYRVLKEPTAGNNTFIYALNDIAAKTIPIAEKDPRLSEIIGGGTSDGKAVTIAAVQPTVYEYRNNGRLSYSNQGMLVVTVNWQAVDGKLDNPNSTAANSFDALQGRVGESHQQVWNVMVDLSKGTVTDILENPERVMTNTIQQNTIYIGINMYLPNAVKIEPRTTLKWINISDMPHNVVGVYKTSSGHKIPIDSGFMNKGDSWKYTFDEEGMLEYYCSTHSEDGMKGSVIISK